MSNYHHTITRYNKMSSHDIICIHVCIDMCMHVCVYIYIYIYVIMITIIVNNTVVYNHTNNVCAAICADMALKRTRKEPGGPRDNMLLLVLLLL